MVYCKYCCEEFKSPKELKKHEKKCAKEEETYEDYDEKFICRNCHQTFYSKQELKRHVLNCDAVHRID